MEILKTSQKQFTMPDASKKNQVPSGFFRNSKLLLGIAFGVTAIANFSCAPSAGVSSDGKGAEIYKVGSVPERDVLENSQMVLARLETGGKADLGNFTLIFEGAEISGRDTQVTVRVDNDGETFNYFSMPLNENAVVYFPNGERYHLCCVSVREMAGDKGVQIITADMEEPVQTEKLASFFIFELPPASAPEDSIEETGGARLVRYSPRK